MAIGRVSGSMLFSNLERQGIDLSIDTDLIYFDVNAKKIAINKTNPQEELDIAGNIKAQTGYFFDTYATISYLTEVQSSVNKTGDLLFQNNIISSKNIDQNIILDPLGLGAVDVSNSTIINLANPVLSLDATNKQYVDGKFGNMIFSGSTMTSTTGNIVIQSSVEIDGLLTIGDLTIDGTGSSTTFNLGNIKISGNTIESTNVNGNILLDPNSLGMVVMVGVNGFIPPSGGISDRPLAPPEGLLRYNSELNIVEFYNGIDWISCAPPTTNISSQTIEGDGVTKIFALNEEATSESVIVSVNGTVQRPNISYIVIADQIEFQEPPAVGDIVDVRFITKTFSITLDNDARVDGGSF